jgi:hypothetical protein
MQLKAIAIYSRHTGALRRIDFTLGALNILTGKSKTGKSTVLDIVDYCLGRDDVALPAGRQMDAVSWVALIIQNGNGRIMIARPNPETARTNQAMLVVGDNGLDFPAENDLHANADTTVLREQLSEHVGVEQYRVEPVQNRLTDPYDVSIRQALLLCFQKQTEIASQEYLFHRQSESYARDAIKDTLPYFLGATGPEEATLRRQVLVARRLLRRAERDLAIARDEESTYNSRIAALADEAAALGLAFETTNGDALRILRGALSPLEETFSIESSDTGEAFTRASLIAQRRELRSELRRTDEELNVSRQVMAEEQKVVAEAEIQVSRLSAAGIVPNAENVDSSTCPLCEQGLDQPDSTISELLILQDALRAGLSASAATQPRRQTVVGELEAIRASLIEQLRTNTVALETAEASERAEVDQQNLHERRIFLRGRITQELSRQGDDDENVTELERLVRERGDRVRTLEGILDQVDVESALRDILNTISEDMTIWAQRLELEHSQNQVRLDINGPSVAVLTPGGRRTLRRIGSAENWIGYHLVAHLALHRWLALQQRPVPRFLMLDQPSQAFFPEEVPDGSEVEDADWEAVRRQFMLLRDVVEDLEGDLQIIVCDHANLVDRWFQDCLVDNWRGGNALVPADWFAAEEKDQVNEP